MIWINFRAIWVAIMCIRGSENQKKFTCRGIEMNVNTRFGRLAWACNTMMLAALLIAGGAGTAGANELAEGCAECHGKDGASSEPTVPVIGGISALYMMDNLALYKDEARPCVEAEYLDGPNKGSKTDMCKIAAELSEGDMESLGEFSPASRSCARSRISMRTRPPSERRFTSVTAKNATRTAAPRPRTTPVFWLANGPRI